MDERTRRLIDRQKETFIELAHTQAEQAIGETVVRMHEQASELTKDTLIAALLKKAQATKSVIEREQFEYAARKLGWAPETQG